MIIIAMNMACMGAEHYKQSPETTDLLYYLNVIFIAIFTGECVLKLIGLRHYYFKQPWNVFDFVVVVMSILGKFFILEISPVALFTYCRKGLG